MLILQNSPVAGNDCLDNGLCHLGLKTEPVAEIRIQLFIQRKLFQIMCFKNMIGYEAASIAIGRQSPV